MFIQSSWHPFMKSVHGELYLAASAGVSWACLSFHAANLCLAVPSLVIILRCSTYWPTKGCNSSIKCLRLAPWLVLDPRRYSLSAADTLRLISRSSTIRHIGTPGPNMARSVRSPPSSFVYNLSYFCSLFSLCSADRKAGLIS